jgi:hypothetical protein
MARRYFSTGTSRQQQMRRLQVIALREHTERARANAALATGKSAHQTPLMRALAKFGR